MPTPAAPEPLEETPRGAALAGDPEDAAGTEVEDLAAIPAFLRGRPGRMNATPTRAGISGPPIVPVPDAASLPMVGIAPRRLMLIGVAIVLAWLVVSFGRQVAEASAASSRADELRAATATLGDEVTALEQELRTIQDQRYIAQVARAFRLGAAREIPFALEAGAPPLGPDAPGSFSVRLGADAAPRNPLARWLDVLFGPGG